MMPPMVVRKVKVPPNEKDLIEGFERIRRAMRLPKSFPAEVEAEAEAAAGRDPVAAGEHADKRAIPFITIDPPGSRDLDQAFHAEESPDGYRIHYAIADPGWFIEPEGPLDLESRRRGQTLYSPDRRVGLYPSALGEGAASLLPDQVRPAVLWTIEVDRRAEPVAVGVQRTLVCSRRRLAYEEAQQEIDAGEATETLQLLRKVGKLRQERERERGGMNLEVPEQEIERSNGSFILTYRAPLPVEEWNAQISLLTGMCAARLMLDAGIGLLRTMPPPEAETVAGLRAGAELVGVPWPEGMTYQELIGGLDATLPGHAALLTLSTRLFRGAGYVAFDGAAPEQPEHHAIAAPYAHVTAPLRRLADRFTNEVVLAVSRGEAPPAWARERLPELPELMKEAHRREGELERRTVDHVEAAVLGPRVGETFEAVVVEKGAKGSTIQVCEPAVLARCEGDCGSLGGRITARLVEANLEKGMVRFEAA